MRKRIIPFLSLFLLVFLLVGCNKQESKKEYTVELDGNPTTGYTWSYTLSANDIVNVVKDEYVQNESDGEDMVGVPGKQIYTFEGKNPGEVTVHLVYKRNWEETSEGQVEYDYILSVADDLTVSLKEKKLF